MIITDTEREALYKTIFSRRDVRKEFLSKEVPDDVLMRILTAAHHAPSVGFMQPWDFVIVRNLEVKKKIKQAFEVANADAEAQFAEKKRAQYKALKLEGILEAPLGICVTCDRTRNGPVVLGRTSTPEMDLFSTVCAVQNLWLAARAENLGMGWVSIISNESLKSILGIPEHIVPIAYLCIGYVSEFKGNPDLEVAGWLPREELSQLIHENHWDN
ncbi:MAG TPA: 5,6-dimethylbenzimidazole synthase [Thiotrichaceae bacterium]|nr:5,6-dimethylbenzimidazole synthase [Thiotrichaceae bacterium]